MPLLGVKVNKKLVIFIIVNLIRNIIDNQFSVHEHVRRYYFIYYVGQCVEFTRTVATWLSEEN